MDYEKKYNEAIERMRKMLGPWRELAYNGKTFLQDLESIFPELRESEDERIKKELIEFIKWSVDRHFMREDFHQAKRPSEWIAYLEKKKEYHIPWYDYQKSKEAGYTIVPNEEYEQLIKQKEQNPAWSEEDEEIFNNIIEKAKGGHWIEVNEITWLINRFKSLRPSWKPSEDQMDALKELIDDANRDGWVTPGATALYEQLKKL